jgi:hypothetical protein
LYLFIDTVVTVPHCVYAVDAHQFLHTRVHTHRSMHAPCWPTRTCAPTPSGLSDSRAD